MKWCVLSESDDSDHYRMVSAQLTSYSQKNIFEFVKATAVDFDSKLKVASAKFDFVLVGSDLSALVAPLVPKMYVDIGNLNFVDGLIKEKDGSFWPAQFADQAIVKWISTECKDVGVTNPAFVVGSGGLARAVVSGLIKAGFTTIVVTDSKVEEAQSMVEEMKKVFFNINIQVCQKEHITLLPGIHSLCVNTVSIFDDLELFKELFYCNFIKRGGVVMDLNRHPIETPLLKLSRGIAGKLYSGFQFWAYHDAEWIEKVFSYRIDVAKHGEELKKVFGLRPFDETKVSQILDL